MKSDCPTGRFRFELANADDDPALRALLRANPMDGGSLRVSFEREPSFFAAAAVGSECAQVGVAREQTADGGGRIVGVGTRAIRRAFWNGEASGRVGYLSDLRLEAALRGGMLVARGYRFLRELHKDGQASVYYTVIFADNARALSTIAAGRAGLPVYHDLGLLNCPGVRLDRRTPIPPQVRGVSVERGRVESLSEIVDCLNRNGRRKQFSPVHAVEDFDPPRPRWPGLRAEDFFVARRVDGQVIGVAAAWDQRAFKQTRVHGYGGALRWREPLARGLRQFAPGLLPRLPDPGEHLPFFHACFVAVDEDNASVFRLILRAMHDAFRKGEFLYFLVGLHERDPLNAALDGFALLPFAGRIFRVSLDDEPRHAPDPLDGRIPGIEAALL